MKEKKEEKFIFSSKYDENTKDFAQSLLNELKTMRKNLEEWECDPWKSVILINESSFENFFLFLSTKNFLDKLSNKKTLFLDLDETLIHSCNSFDNPEYILKLKLSEGTINV